MKILKLSLGGFKNIGTVTLNLAHITAVVGFNNFGKTNLLKSIEFASRFLRNPQQRYELMADDSLIPINISNAGNDYSFLIRAESGETEFEYSFSFSWAKNEKHGSIKEEELKIKSNTSGRFIKHIMRTGNGGVYKNTVEGRCQRTLQNLDDCTLAIEYLKEKSPDIYYIDIINAVLSFNVDYNRLTDSRIEPRDDSGTDNILAAIKHMHKYYPDKYTIWENTVRSLVPAIEEFIFETERQTIPAGGVNLPYNTVAEKHTMSVKERYMTKNVDLFRLSSGIRRILLLVLNIVLAPINKLSVIEFEELESSINPLMLQRLLITISSICEDCSIIITSHSPALLNFIDIENVYIGMPDVSGAASFGTIKKSKRNALLENADEMGIGIGDFIFGLLVEDMSPVSDWVEKSE